MVKEQTRNHKRTFAACTSTRRLPGATDTAEMRATDLFLDYLEYLDFKAAEGDSLDASSGDPPGGHSGVDSNVRPAHTGSGHNVFFYAACSQSVNEDHCARVDTGCQRTPIGAKTPEVSREQSFQTRKSLFSISQRFPQQQTRSHAFLQVWAIQAVYYVRQCIEEEQSSSAPFLLSFPFLFYCHSSSRSES